jgi:AraC-like DNA-binding protein
LHLVLALRNRVVLGEVRTPAFRGELTIKNAKTIAEVAHLSPRQFSRAFQAETGQTPAKAVENLRLERARALMEDTNHTLDVVAQLTGFGDRNRMRRAFLRAWGQPPQVILRQSRGYIEGSEFAEASTDASDSR